MFVYSDQVMGWMKDALTARPEFGFQYIDFGDPDDLIPGYPAVIITENPLSRILHATHTYAIQLSVDLWILHANLKIAKAPRRIETIQLCNQIRDFLDLNMNLPDVPNTTLAEENTNPPGNIIQGWISGESPGVLRRKGTPILATRMTWEGLSQQRF
jgi:hypothetical protein